MIAEWHPLPSIWHLLEGPGNHAYIRCITNPAFCLSFKKTHEFYTSTTPFSLSSTSQGQSCPPVPFVPTAWQGYHSKLQEWIPRACHGGIPPQKKKTTSGMRRKLVTIRGWRWKHGNSCRNPKNPLNLHFVRIASYSGVCIDPRYGFVAVIQSAGLCEPFIFTQILFNIAKKQLAGFIHQIFPKRSFSGEKIAWKPPFSNNKLCAIHFSEQIFKRTTIKTFEMASPVVFLWWGYYLITCHGW